MSNPIENAALQAVTSSEARDQIYKRIASLDQTDLLALSGVREAAEKAVMDAMVQATIKTISRKVEDWANEMASLGFQLNEDTPLIDHGDYPFVLLEPQIGGDILDGAGYFVVGGARTVEELALLIDYGRAIAKLRGIEPKVSGDDA